LWSVISYHSVYTDTLLEIADSLNLDLSTSINLVLTQYTNNSQDSNSVIDLIFLWTKFEEYNNHQIILELHCSLDYTLLLVLLAIEKEYI